MRIGLRQQAIAERIGARVRQRRRELGLDQSELALVSGVSTRTIHAVENGKPTAQLAAVATILDALGLELDAVERGQGSP